MKDLTYPANCCPSEISTLGHWTLTNSIDETLLVVLYVKFAHIRTTMLKQYPITYVGFTPENRCSTTLILIYSD